MKKINKYKKNMGKENTDAVVGLQGGVKPGGV